MMLSPWIKVSAAVCAGGGCLGWWLLSGRRLCSAGKLVAITGCDSGVGYSTALHCHNRGMVVVAMVLRLDSSGAQALLDLGKVSGRMEVICVDVTSHQQVVAAFDQVNRILDSSNCVFHALINNAGVMVFGETEWQTEHTISMQLDVNLTGAIRITKVFAPLLRKYRGRVINVSSHCAKLPLPGLAIYAASKAGLQAWSDALRVEWGKYGITVISLIPGAFFQQTNILSHQMEYAKEMQSKLTVEAAGFYGDYFHQYHRYLSGLAGEKPVAPVTSLRLYNMLDSALLDCQPRPFYHDTPWRYSLYHTLAALSPTTLKDRLVTKFTAMPEFKA